MILSKYMLWLEGWRHLLIDSPWIFTVGWLPHVSLMLLPPLIIVLYCSVVKSKCWKCCQLEKISQPRSPPPPAEQRVAKRYIWTWHIDRIFVANVRALTFNHEDPIYHRSIHHCRKGNRLCSIQQTVKRINENFVYPLCWKIPRRTRKKGLSQFDTCRPHHRCDYSYRAIPSIRKWSRGEFSSYHV